MDPYEAMANAIVLEAVKDYREALKQLKRNRRYRDAIIMKEECETFFQSEWFQVLTKIDGAALMLQLQKEAA